MKTTKKIISMILAFLIVFSMSALAMGVGAQTGKKEFKKKFSRAVLGETFNAFETDSNPDYEEEYYPGLYDLKFEKGTLAPLDYQPAAYTLEEFLDYELSLSYYSYFEVTYDQYLENRIEIYSGYYYDLSYEEIAGKLTEMGYEIPAQPTKEEMLVSWICYDYIMDPEFYEELDLEVPDNATAYETVVLIEKSYLEYYSEYSVDYELPLNPTFRDYQFLSMALDLAYSFDYYGDFTIKISEESTTYEGVVLELITEILKENYGSELPANASLRQAYDMLSVKYILSSYDFEDVPDDLTMEDLPYFVVRQLVIRECGEEAAPEGAKIEVLFKTLQDSGYFDYESGPFYSDCYDYTLSFDEHVSTLAVWASFYSLDDVVTINGKKMKDETPMTLNIEGVDVIKIKVKNSEGLESVYNIEVINPEEGTKPATAPPTTSPSTTAPTTEFVDDNPDTGADIDLFAVVALLISAAVFATFLVRKRAKI